MNVLAVREAGKEAIAYARGGKGPYILEMQTYRYRGHSMSDPAKYRTREEVDAMRKDHDPIKTLNAVLVAAGIDDQRIKAVDTEVKAVVAEAADFALASPEPDTRELMTDGMHEGGVV